MQVMSRSRVAELLDRFIFIALLALIALAVLFGGSTDEWRDALFELAVFVLGALWLLEALCDGAWRAPEDHHLLPAVFLVGLACLQTQLLPGRVAQGSLGLLSAIGSASPHETQLVIYKWLALVLMGGLLFRHVRNAQRVRSLACLILILGVVSAVLGFALQAAIHDPIDSVLPFAGKQLGYGQFQNRNHFAYLMEMTLGLTLGQAVISGASRRWRLVCMAAASCVWVALLMTTSRGAVISLLCQAALLGALLFSPQLLRAAQNDGGGSQQQSFRGWSLRVALVCCLVVVTGLAVAGAGGDRVIARLESVPRELKDKSPDRRAEIRRLDIWRATWQLIKDHPLTGVGFGAYATVIPAYDNASGEFRLQQAHNDYLETLASGGLVALLLIAWQVIWLVRAARLNAFSSDAERRAISVGALIGIFGVAVHSLFDFGLHPTANAVVFVALIVIATTQIPMRKMVNARPRVSTHPRWLTAGGAAAACLLLMVVATKSFGAGLARRLSYTGEERGRLSEVDLAVALSPTDAETHRARAGVLRQQHRFADAVESGEQAITLNPHDYTLWLAVASDQAETGDFTSALASCETAIRLAPFYAKPHWEAGALLLKTGRTDQAFFKLRQAAQSDPELVPELFNLAWSGYEGDGARVINAVGQPDGPDARRKLLWLFVKRGALVQGMEIFRGTPGLPAGDKYDLVRELCAAKLLDDACEVWSSMPASDRQAAKATAIIDEAFADKNHSEQPRLQAKIGIQAE
jgi:O-antigen ligase